ncbi:MAG TPA: nucleoside triphosphate pyrophosphohydrolase [Dehalococcoidia bacterium]|nr:nucleoside triphosphate pyrophosphohydrolase [Dehalococcoidia bacterium]
MPASVPLTIVGLGPGDPALLTVEARVVLDAAPEVWFRTLRHPTLDAVAVPARRSFDDLYDTLPSFDAVYAEIVERVLALAARPDGVVYAVPGHPLFGEATVRALLARAGDAGLGTRVVAGVSFVDAAVTALALDPLADGLLLLDALDLGGHRRLLVPERPTLIAQVYDQRAATQAKLALLDAYPAEHPVRVVRAGHGGGPDVRGVPLAALDRDPALFDHLVTVYVPPLALVDDVRSFEGLRAIVAQLRNPDGGCPWDLEQTHESLKRFLVEEAYEALDALDAGEPHRLAEELGDLLMQVVLHAQVAEDHGEFRIEDVVGSIAAKLVRRHPHVFGGVTVSGAGEVLQNWEVLKREERGDAPLLDAVPKALPALAQAQSLQSRAARAGFPAPDAQAAREALHAVASAPELTPTALGDALFGLVALARSHDIDAEEALRVAIARFRARVAQEERARS